MSGAGISVRPLADLVEVVNTKSEVNAEGSPLKLAEKKGRKKAATTGKKTKQEPITSDSTVKRSRTSKKILNKDDRQKTIDSFFKSASKTYEIEPSKEIRSSKKQVKKSRRRIIYNDKSDTTTASNESKYQTPTMRKTKIKPVEFIDLCEDEEIVNSKRKNCQRILQSSSSSDKSEKTVQQNDTALPSPANEIEATENSNKSSTHSSKKSENAVTEKNNNENNSVDDVIPPSSQSEIISVRKQKTTLGLQLSITKTSKAKNHRKRSLSPAATVTEMHNQTVYEPIVSILENSPPTTSTSTTNNTSSNHIKRSSNDKENFVPETPVHSSFSHFKETSELICSTIDETTLVSTEIQADIIVDISDDDFEYVQRKTSNKSKTSNSRKSRSQPKNNEPVAKKVKKTPRPVPPYKIIEGTNGTMAVDAFCFGDIEGVSHYFLTHFHADHYVGLTRKFAHDIYMSAITARLLRVFIPIEEQYIKEIDLNKPITIDNIQVTAIDANHCPGAIMLIFKLPDGRCMLHTGDFRAHADMESEPVFWNNDIHTIYLDTTYIHQKNVFCHQTESIERAQNLMQEFIEKNVGTRTLFVCGSYLIGKEKFWSTLARNFNFKVFSEGNRQKSLLALCDETLNELLTECPTDAQMHVIPLQKISYNSLLEYYDKYAEHFDVIFALRPSGWEKNSKPQYRGKINIIGIEYSEHSSRDEMQRFVQYLKPQNVISTVPVNSDAMITAKVPKQWYKYTTLKRQYQPSITTFFKMKPDKYFRRLTEKYTTISTNNSMNKDDIMERTQNEPSMLISPDTVINDAVDDDADLTICDSNSLPKQEVSREVATVKEPSPTIVPKLKPKQEALAKVPVVEEPIVIDCDTDDDWLT